MSDTASATSRPPALVWSWPHVLIGLVFALPAVIVTVIDPDLGIPLAVGVLPATMIGIPAQRRRRIMILLIGTLAGAGLFVGGVLAHLPLPLAVVALAAAVVGAALLATTVPAGRIVLVLCVPLAGAGLSYDDLATSAATFGLLVAGALYAWLVALLWPAHAAPERGQRPLPPRDAMLDYGVRLGIAAALVYAITRSLGLDHPGWAPAACLLVARPQLDLLQSRGVGRVLSVIIGALVAAVLLHLDPSNLVLAVVAGVTLGAAAGTAGSRWYITSGFTTLLVFVMLLYGDPADTTQKFVERVGETILGVAAAYLFGWALPAVRARLRKD